MSNLFQIQLVAVHGITGSRTDFVAGWLGTLPRFLNNQWTIDSETGQSRSLGQQLKELENYHGPAALNQLLSNYNYRLAARSSWSYAGSYHESNLAQKTYPTDASAIKSIVIDTNKCNPTFILWENIVKTFMTRHRYTHAFNTGAVYGIDFLLLDARQPINDQSRCKWIDNLLDSWTVKSSPVVDLNTHVIEYDELFRPGGSHTIAEKLQLTVTDRDHLVWDHMLTLANAPLQIERFGRVWKYTDLPLY
jgi:hypothetical protein